MRQRLFMDYSKLSIEELQARVKKHEEVIAKCQAARTPHVANTRILNRLNKIIRLKKNLIPS